MENRLAEEKGADGHNVEVPTKSSFVEMDRDEMLMLLARKYFQSLLLPATGRGVVIG